MELAKVVKNNTVHFLCYRAGNLFYWVEVDGERYEFPVPIEDTGDATFPAQDKAILLMRYIRKAINNGTFVHVREYNN